MHEFWQHTRDLDDGRGDGTGDGGGDDDGERCESGRGRGGGRGEGRAGSGGDGARAVGQVVERVLATDLLAADRAAVEAVLADASWLQRCVEGLHVACARRLEQLAASTPSLLPEHVVAEHTRTGLRHGTRLVERAATTVALPTLGAALGDGDVSAAHVDVLTGALRQLAPERRQQLLDRDQRLAEVARTTTVDDFRRTVARELRSIEADDGLTRLQRQRTQVRLRTWVDDGSGLVCLSGRFDPESGMQLTAALDLAVDTAFRSGTPPGCPADPLAKQEFLRAHALLALAGIAGIPGGGSGRCGSRDADGPGAPGDPGGAGGVGGVGGRVGGGGRPRFVVTIDERTLQRGRHAASRVDPGAAGIELPIEVLRRHAEVADVVPVVMRDGVAVAVGRPAPLAGLDTAIERLADGAGVPLDLGRAVRHATRAQRDALHAMYRWCAVPGCRVPVGRCEPHHLVHWEHGGRTDLCSLVPVCKHHHDQLHQRHWQLQLAPDRSLTITGPDGTIMATGPPGDQWG